MESLDESRKKEKKQCPNLEKKIFDTNIIENCELSNNSIEVTAELIHSNIDKEMFIAADELLNPPVNEHGDNRSTLTTELIQSSDLEKGSSTVADDLSKLSIKEHKEDEETIVLETVDITSDKSGGLLKQTVQPGEGDESPAHGDRVSVYYTGYLLTREKPIQFETNRGQEKCEFNLGRGLVIKGWDLGIATMKKGEIALFIIQPEYAYGPMGHPPKIPAHTPLLFEVELCEWKYEDLSLKKDGSILRKTIEIGEGTVTPNEGSKVTVQLTGYYNDTVFQDCEKEFILGQGCTMNVLEAIETALFRFRVHEKSYIYLTGKALIDSGIDTLGIPKDTDIKYEITLLSLERVKDVWEMNTDEKFAKASDARERGIDFVKAGHFKVALRQFKLIVMCLENEPGAPLEQEEARKSLLLSGYLNLVLCFMKLESYIDAIKFCDKALLLDPDNEKALFRKAQSKMFMNDCEEALEDLKGLCNIYPENKAAKQSLLVCQEKIKKQKLKDKGIYNKMFEKFMKQDQERLKNMKTETGIWQDDKKAEMKQQFMNETQRLIERNNSFLRDANIIELSNTATSIT